MLRGELSRGAGMAYSGGYPMKKQPFWPEDERSGLTRMGQSDGPVITASAE